MTHILALLWNSQGRIRDELEPCASSPDDAGDLDPDS